MEKIKEVCEICGEFEGSRRQITMHQVTCKKKLAAAMLQIDETQEKIDAVPQPEDVRKREEPDRAKRVPFGVPQKRLKTDDEKGYHHRIFNDNWAKDPDRVRRAQAAGYEIVEGKKPIVVGTNEDKSPIMGVEMRIPQEFYEEDQKVKQKEVDRVDEAIMKGKISQEAGDNRYIPQGIKIHSSNNPNN